VSPPEYAKILKLNPYHDKNGRFTSKPGAHSVSWGGKFKKLNDRDKAEYLAEVKASEAYKKAHEPPPYKKYDVYGTTVETSLGVGDTLMRDATQKQWDSLTPKERRDIVTYTGSFSKRLNEHVNPTPTYEKIQQPHTKKGMDASVKALDKALDKMEVPDNVVAYRAMTQRVWGLDKYDVAKPDFFEKLVGTEFKDKSYGSTSIDKEVAGGFMKQGRVMLEINVKKGAKGAYLGQDKERTHHSSESELLLPRNSRYKITGYRHEGSGTYTRHIMSVDLI